MTPNKIHVAVFAFAALFAASPLGPLGLGFVTSAVEGRVGVAIVDAVFMLVACAAIAMGRRVARLSVLIVSLVATAAGALSAALLETSEYTSLFMVLYVLACGLSLGVLASSALCLASKTVLQRLWRWTIAALASGLLAFQILACVLETTLHCAAAILVASVFAAGAAVRVGVGGIDGFYEYKALTTVSFVTYGLGCSLYAGTALFSALDAADPGVGAARWLAFLLGGCASFLVCVPLGGFLSKGKYGLAYGNLARYGSAVFPVLGVVDLILLTHTSVAGFFLLAVPPACSTVLMVHTVVDMVRGNRSELLCAAKSALCHTALGAALGMLAVTLLWAVDDELLRYQLVTLYLVVTCLYCVPLHPRRGASAVDLLKDELPENLTASERQAQAAAALAERMHLTQREREVFCLLVTSIPLAQIGEELDISAKTVQNHVSNIYAKLGVHSLRDALRMLEE